MRAMTSWAKVPGQSTWDTKPLAQASWAVSFLPLSNISLAWKREAVRLILTENEQQVSKRQRKKKVMA